MLQFFREFFGQDQLYQNVPNIFRYTDGRENNSLVIEQSYDYDQETQNAVPALVIQEGGFSEEMPTLGNRKVWDSHSNFELYLTPLTFPYTIHCIAEEKGSAKFLQAATTKGIMTFRWALYEAGIQFISPIQGMSPQLIRSGGSVPEMYDCPITFQLRMQDDWFLDRTGDALQQIRISFHAVMCELEYDESGNPVIPSTAFNQVTISGS
jgi:hypothetical protein